jgi:hemerythrin
MPLRCCIICKAGASPDLQLQYCAVCQSALYCSKACQRKDWRKQHKQICKLLNVGHGDMQFRTPIHTALNVYLKERFEREERHLDEEDKRFFKVFEESMFEGSRAAARKMRNISKRQTKNYQKFLLSHSIRFHVWSDSEMVSWPNSPLLVMLQFVDPNVLYGDEDALLQEGETRGTPLHSLVDLADLSDYSTHENKLIIAKQLIEHGANVNAASIPHGRTPLHSACCWDNVTNLDFVELLLKEGADPNSQDDMGLTP